MNLPQQPSAPAAQPAAPEATQRTTLEERTSKVIADLNGSPSATAGDTTSANPHAAGSSAASEGDKAREERRARLAQLQAKDRQRVDLKQKQAAAEKLQRELEAATRRATDAETKASTALDRALLKNPAQLLGLMEAEGVSATEVAKAIQEAITNPEKQAHASALKAAHATIDPKLSALEKRVAEQDAQIATFLAAQQSQQTSAQDAQNLQQFKELVGKSAEHAPMAAKLLAHDPDEFMAIADMAGSRIPEGSGAEALLDKIEDLLDGDSRALVKKYASLYGFVEADPSKASAPPPQRAAAKANTVSNSLAAQRASVVDEDDFASLDLDERARRLTQQLNRS